MKVAVSACLLGVPCRFDGGASTCNEILALGEYHELVPVCPELLGGLVSPREPVELVNEFGVFHAIDRVGQDVTQNFKMGAARTLERVLMAECTLAILKERSPSCGHGLVYDGTFSGVLIAGDGVTTRVLKAAGIPVVGETDYADALTEPGIRSGDFANS